VKKITSALSSNRVRAAFSIIISLGAIYLAIRNVDFGLVWETLKNTQLAFVLLAIASVLINGTIKAWRWKVLVGPNGKTIPNIKYWKILFAGQMLNTIFPARLGDLARAFTLGGLGPGRTFVLGTIVLEKMLDSLAYLILFGVLFILIPLPGWMGDSILAFLLITLIIVGFILLLAFFPDPFSHLSQRMIHYLPINARAWISPRLKSGLTSLEIIRRRDDLVRLTILTGLVWCTALLNNHLVLLALDIQLPLTASLLILIGLQAGISIPAVPGSIGLFEYICVLALSFFGVDQSLAFSYGLLLHAVVYVPMILIGVVSFWQVGLSGHRLKLLKDSANQPT
jgi:uncharacterized protein (TIRG00374 family)